MIEGGGRAIGWQGRVGPRRKDSVEISCLRDAFVLTLDVERPEGQTGWRDALRGVDPPQAPQRQCCVWPSTEFLLT